MSRLNELMIGFDQNLKDWTPEDVKTKFFAQNPMFADISFHFEKLSGAALLGLTEEQIVNNVEPKHRILGSALFNTLQSLNQTKQGACLTFFFYLSLSTKRSPSSFTNHSPFIIQYISYVLTIFMSRNFKQAYPKG